MSAVDETPSSDTEKRILEAATRVFIKRGTAGARTQEIADEAGLNKALLHYYFRSKDKLAEAVFLQVARDFFPLLLGTLSSDLPLRQKLQAFVDVELDMLAAKPFLPGYIITEMQYRPQKMREVLNKVAPIEEMRATMFGKIQQQIDHEVEAGHMRPGLAEDQVIMMISLMIFPFAAAKMINIIAGIDDEAHHKMMARRREDIVTFVLNGLKT